MPVSPTQDKSNTLDGTTQEFDMRWCFAFFVVSGFCGLIYEVVWLRLAMSSFSLVNWDLARGVREHWRAESWRTMDGERCGFIPSLNCWLEFHQLRFLS